MRQAIWGLALGLWLAAHSGVSRADDAPVVRESQAETRTPAAAASDGRRWRQLDPERPPGMEPSAPESHESYLGWLVASYFAVPALVVGLPVLVGQIGHGEGAGIAFLVGYLGGMSLPATVHWVHGDTGRGVRDILGVPLLTGFGMLIGALIGAGLTSDEGQDNDDFNEEIGNGFVGGLIGGGIVLVGWAIFDVVDTAGKWSERRPSQPRGLRVAFAPSTSGVVGTLTARF